VTYADRTLPAPAAPASKTLGRSVAGMRLRALAYVSLTKPRIVELLLVTTLPTMFLAKKGLPSIGLMLATLVGGVLTAGAANTLNCYIDRDIDRMMSRTARRPLVQGVISVRGALVFGLALGVCGTALLGFAVNWPAAALADAALLFYVFVYTLGLKRRSPSNIVIGGAAGAVPVLVGWAAVTGTVGWPAAALFLVIFLWTPPHFWALAMKYRDDYTAAGVPMLPVVADQKLVARRIVAYSYAMVAASLSLVPVLGWLYGVAAGALGAAFLVDAHRMHHRVCAGKPPDAIRLFRDSIHYLSLLFALIAVIALLP
jgi:protoheme IX farnesyltransferase